MKITLCGSCRFIAWFDAWDYVLTMAGHTVYSISRAPVGMRDLDDADKRRADEAHKRKIEASDAIVVLNVMGYIGESTLTEIEHARRKQRSIYFLESWGKGCGIGSMHTPRMQRAARAYGIAGMTSPIDTWSTSNPEVRADPFRVEVLGPAGPPRSRLVQILRECADVALFGATPPRRAMDIARYEAFVAETAIPQPSQEPWPVYYTLGLTGEAGEVAEQVKKTLRQEGGDFMARRDAIVREIGDVIWYATALAASLGSSLGEVIDANVSKLRARRAQGNVAGDGSDREIRLEAPRPTGRTATGDNRTNFPRLDHSFVASAPEIRQVRSQLPRVIAFCGPAGSGKSTAAAHLVERYGYTRVRMAEPLKAMLITLGLERADVDGDRKEVSHPLLGGKTPRQVMQTLGTDWGRRMVHPDLWTRAWTEHAKAVLVAGGSVVVDDVRFDNEAALVRGSYLFGLIRSTTGSSRSGDVVEIARAGVCYREDHASECGIARSLIDHTIAPAEGVDHVRAEVDALMAELGGGS